MSQIAKSEPDVILLVGKDDRLLYLLQRYFELYNCKVVPSLTVPSELKISTFDPVMIIFSTTELLESGQSLLDFTSKNEIPVVVCTSVSGEAHARELGADACFLHPLTLDNFQSTLDGIYPIESGLQTKISGF